MKYLLMYKLLYLFKFLEFVGIPLEGDNNPNKDYTEIEILKKIGCVITIGLFIIIILLFIILIFQIIKTFKK